MIYHCFLQYQYYWLVQYHSLWFCLLQPTLLEYTIKLVIKEKLMVTLYCFNINGSEVFVSLHQTTSDNHHDTLFEPAL